MPVVLEKQEVNVEINDFEEQFPSPKQQIQEGDIFKPRTEVISPTLLNEDEELENESSDSSEEEEVYEPEPPPPPEPIKKKGRKPMSEEHKAKLKLAREKALVTRRRNAMEKKEVKELQKKKKQMDIEKLRNEVNGPTIKEVVTEKETFTKKDIEEAQLNAITNYEKLRKQRKKKKVEEQKDTKDKEEIKTKLMKATNFTSNRPDSRYGDQDYFSNCW